MELPMSDTAFNVCLKPLINDSTDAQDVVNKQVFLLCMTSQSSFFKAIVLLATTHRGRSIQITRERACLCTDLFADCHSRARSKQKIRSTS